jgi:hypothetical protein
MVSTPAGKLVSLLLKRQFMLIYQQFQQVSPQSAQTVETFSAAAYGGAQMELPEGRRHRV